MKYFFFVSFVILASQVLSCGQGCGTCNRNRTCGICYGRELTKNGSCAQGPTVKNCIVHKDPNSNRCAWCTQNTTFDPSGYGRCITEGNQTLIDNCVQKVKVGRRTVCGACNNGTYPTRDGSYCRSYNTTAFPGCNYAVRTSTGRPYCISCKGDLSADTNGLCIISDVRGCSAVKRLPNGTNIECQICNIFNNFYQTDRFRINCTKGSFVRRFEETESSKTEEQAFSDNNRAISSFFSNLIDSITRMHGN